MYSSSEPYELVIGGRASRPAGPPLDQWQTAGFLAWSMQNIASFLPVRAIPRGARTTAFGSTPHDLSDVPVTLPWDAGTSTFAQIMANTATDAWIVTKDGAVVAEEYIEPMSPQGVHLLMSVSKSLTTATAGTLMGTGELDAALPVSAYVPALALSGYAGATVRDLLDMRTGIRFSENYLDSSAEVRLLEEAIGWAPRVHEGVPDTLLGFLATLIADRIHGGRFDYKSCETDALGFVIEGATGRHPADVMSERLWQPMGAESDAHVGVDGVGEGMFDGGISASLRDLARFGSLFLRDGFALDGVPVLPTWWVEDTVTGAPDSREAFAAASEPTLMDGGMYRNGFWFPRAGSDVFLALGIHGQMIYINRAAGVVAAKLSTWTTPQDGMKLLSTIAAFDAAAWALV
ncbi:serine hydrolase domain-containing protein [Microbacterium sp. ASV49]|uniref:Serine hydrolase n=1 Tax=Microbacterium candidum TaxID=3041922 RepID=A0ABT7MV34_9MICO|nr:serine hydrolase [Microbacterium sp. ASV49]MDL9978288.1 serine hydrolase [Microbacterium sp. ASV49]